MPSQLSIDLTRTSVCAVEIDGTAKKPVVKSFGLVHVDELAKDEEDQERALMRALQGHLKAHGATRDPAGAAFDSKDCTVREMELPFSADDQIQKVLKFEAESHLHLVDIDDVVVTYQKLTADRGGSRLLVMAYEKALILERFALLEQVGVDPQFVDVHLTALFTALIRTGYLVAEEIDEVPLPGAEPEEAVVVLECDRDLTHILAVRGETLLGARAFRLSTGGGSASHDESALDDDEDEDDDTLIVVDFSEDEELPPAVVPQAGYLARLRREVQRTLLPLGLSDEVRRLIVTGSLTRDQGFLEALSGHLGMEVEVARVFDQVEHSLDDQQLEVANASGTAALGVAFRLLDPTLSDVDLRREECQYAKRFDQVKVALACMTIMLLILIALPTIERYKAYLLKQHDLREAAYAALREHEVRSSGDLRESLNAGVITAKKVVQTVRDQIRKQQNSLASELGRTGAMEPVPSGLDYLNEIISVIDASLPQVGRLELNLLDLDLTKDTPILKIKGLMERQSSWDQLKTALLRCRVVESVGNPRLEPAKDGRTELNNLDVKLRRNVEFRSAPGGAP